MATCGCGKKLRSDNKSGYCGPCHVKSPAKREQRRIQSQEWLARNRERARANSREWLENNRDRARSQERAWGKANRERSRVYEDRRYALKRGLFVEDVAKVVVWERDGGVCHLCLQPTDPENWHLDHVIALSEGGPHCYANVAVAHPFCNLSKKDASRSFCGVRWTEATGAYQQFHGREYTP